MLEISKKTTATVQMELDGESVVNGEVVARYTAYISPAEDNITITTVVLDKDKYSENDQTEFEEMASESKNQVMDSYEEIVGLVEPGDDEPDDEPSGDDEPGDDPDDDEKKAGDEETIIP